MFFCSYLGGRTISEDDLGVGCRGYGYPRPSSGQEGQSQNVTEVHPKKQIRGHRERRPPGRSEQPPDLLFRVGLCVVSRSVTSVLSFVVSFGHLLAYDASLQSVCHFYRRMLTSWHPR